MNPEPLGGVLVDDRFELVVEALGVVADIVGLVVGDGLDGEFRQHRAMVVFQVVVAPDLAGQDGGAGAFGDDGQGGHGAGGVAIEVD